MNPALDWVALADSLNADMRAIYRLPVEEQLVLFKGENPLRRLITEPEALAGVFASDNGRRTWIERNGDLLLGFAALERDTPAFELSIGGARHHESLSVPALRRGEWHIALGNLYPIPLINLRFHEVGVHSFSSSGIQNAIRMPLPEGCWALFAYLNTELRRGLCMGGAIVRLPSTPDSCWVFASGMGTFAKGKEEERSALGVRVEIALPVLSIEPSLEEMKARALERMDLLREDLARAAWHLSRVRRWCLEHDDEFAECHCSASSDGSDVVVIDGFFSAAECDSVCAAVASRGGRPLGIYDDGEDVALALAAVDRALKQLGETYALAGRRVQLGDTSAGTHEHRDGACQGGDATLLVYLSDASSGATSFSGRHVSPRKGRAVVFGVDVLHRGEPCCPEEPKPVATFELVRVG